MNKLLRIVLDFYRDVKNLFQSAVSFSWEFELCGIWNLAVSYTHLDVYKRQGLRVKADLRNEKVGFKIREHTLRRVPYMLVCGDKEIAEGKVAVRTRKGADLGTFTIEEFAEILKSQVRKRELKLLGEE